MNLPNFRLRIRLGRVGSLARLLVVFALSGTAVFAQDKPVAVDRAQAVKQRIEAWTKEYDALKATAPPTANVLQDRLAVLDNAIVTAQRHLQSLEILRGIEVRLKLVEKQNSEWKGLGKKPPYSWTEADRYRSALLAARDGMKAAENFKGVVGQTMQSAQDAMAQVEAAVRRAQDALGKAAEEPGKTAAQQQLDLETARLRLMAEQKEDAAIQMEAVDLNFRMEKIKMALATRQLEAVGTDLVFPQDELERTITGLNRQKAELTEERQKALRGGRATINLRLAELGVPARTDVNGWRIALLELQENLWRSRHAWLNAADEETKLRERRKLEDLFSRPAMWRLLFEARLRTVRAAVFEVESRRKEAASDGLDEVIAELGTVAQLIDESIEEAVEMESFAAIWNLAGDRVAGPEGWREWIAGAVIWVTDTTKSLWNFELYTVEDSMDVDGRKVVGKRAITLGKLLILLAIVTVGYYLLKAVAHRVSRRMQARFHLDPGKAQSLQRMILVLGMIVLGLYGLNYVRIPLTAFAFLGGALAIGVGFGTQNLIKNFISGLLIHAEKPLRVGDVLEVGQVNGTVVNIGMRSSVVRHWDGIETLIPNSAFLENNVTNWTYSDRHLRHSVKVGVAYGSDPREIVQLLQDAAAQHSLIMKSPEPYVLFDDFGESTLTFSLYFWLDVAKAGRAQIASDLRFIIARMFREAGVSMAFPQRDMHLATSEPITVRVVGDEPR